MTEIHPGIEKQECDIERCKNPQFHKHNFCLHHYKAEAVKDRWSAWVEMHRQFGMSLEYLAVHPDDYAAIKQPDYFMDLPVVQIGQIETYKMALEEDRKAA